MEKRNSKGQFMKGNKIHLGKKRPNISREKNHNWKGGRTMHEGYVYILCPKHPRAKSKKGYVAEHVLIMEAKLGRYLEPEEVVHHKDFNKLNNKPGNLMLFKTKGEHNSYHAKSGRKIYEK